MASVTPKTPLPIYGALLLTVVVGYLIGRIVTVQSAPVPPITFIDDVNQKQPVVQIDGIENGKIIGSVIGDVRVFFGKDLAAVTNGSFRVPAKPFLTEYVTIKIPAGMQYVASKRGKKYYAVTSAGGERIVPENRLYFRSETEAEAAGYVP